MAENLYAMRCTEFFGTRCANAHSAATKNSKLAKGLNLMRNKLSIAKKGTSLRRTLNAKEQKFYLSTISAALYELLTNGPAAIFLIPMLFA